MYNDNVRKCLICNLHFTSDPENTYALTCDKCPTLEFVRETMQGEPNRNTTSCDILDPILGALLPSKHSITLSCRSREKVYQCDKCKNIFHSQKDLHVHVRIIHDKKPFTCNICYKSFSFYSSMKKHKLLHSTNYGRIKKSYTCEECGKLFDCNATLYIHKKRTHE